MAAESLRTALTPSGGNRHHDPYATSKHWSRKVSIDVDFLNILTSGIKATPNTRSGRTPSLGEVITGHIASSSSGAGLAGRHRTVGKWRGASYMMTGFKGKNSPPAPGCRGGGAGGSGRSPSRERRGTLPLGLNVTTNVTEAGTRFRRMISRRRTSSQDSQDPKSPGVKDGQGQSPDHQTEKKSFRNLAQRVVFERRMSEGSMSGNGPSVGNVFMQALYKQMDKKKMANLQHIATLQTMLEEKRRLRKKFRRAVKITIWCINACKNHCLRTQGASDLSSFYNMNFVTLDTFDGVDLLFDPSKFKANRKARISKEMKRILRKRPEHRSEQEIYYAQIALRNINGVSEFPDRMQKRIAEVGMYEKYDARRVLLRQGHPAHSFYFILSGAVSVVVLEEGRAFAKLVAHLEKGQSFGELAIITRSNRQSNVIVKEKSEFLTISVDDYHRIFMCGGVKSVNDPDHELFVRSLPFLQGWPLQKLEEESKKCVFLYFKRGDVIVKDSQYSDWIIVVKSGSLAVLKKLRKVEAYEWRRPKGFVFVSDKEKRERHDRLTKLRRQVLPELQVPLRSDHSSQGEDEQIRAEGRLRPFVHPHDGPQALGPAVMVTDGANDTKVWDLGFAGLSGSGLDGVTYERLSEGPPQRVSRGGGHSGVTDDGRPRTVGSVGSDSLLPRRRPSVRLAHSGKSLETENLVHASSEGRENFVSEVRTIQQELEEYGSKRDPDDITAADLNPEFVHVQTLTKGMCFGLSDLILGQQCSFCVVSNGADVILVNKQMYHEHASEGLLRRMRQDLCPYPSEEELQTKLQTSVDWSAYRQTTLEDTLKSMRMRKQVRV